MDVDCHVWLAPDPRIRTSGPEMPSGLPSAHPSYPVSSGRGHPVGYEMGTDVQINFHVASEDLRLSSSHVLCASPSIYAICGVALASSSLRVWTARYERQSRMKSCACGPHAAARYSRRGSCGGPLTGQYSKTVRRKQQRTRSCAHRAHGMLDARPLHVRFTGGRLRRRRLSRRLRSPVSTAHMPSARPP